ncbi:polyamine aminopropyltransferase [Roseibium aggregatum]|uniref:Polyamine aminopropyltransferase n=1 Tax=Roseibium aggregatum TaxID=187304 RepID=A0A926NVD3_9HYPH|nr:polyamine aminopropyltransferase [Roseibium aggregatum]MBD1547114.1 polyamine aminopropyltransferase [Roseibium aggregatum]
MSSGLKFNETLHPGVEVSYSCEDILYQDRTEHQDLVLFTNPVFGKVLMLDGITQVTTADEFIYHEMMSHVPILAHGAARNVLIVGGGDCGLAEEVLKHASVEKLTQVEIDASVVEFSREHFGEFNTGVLDDPRFDLVIADGMKFVAETDRRFDVVIVDSTDPQGPGAILFSQDFYDSVHRCLTPGGVLVTQNGVPFLQRQELVTSIERFSKTYADAAAYIAAIPTYFGGHMALGWASDNAELRKTPVAVLEDRFKAAEFKTRYYTPEVHAAAFALPRFILDAVEEGRAKA